MPTVLRHGNMVVRLFAPPREHPPPHVHLVVLGLGEVVIRLGSATASPTVVRSTGLVKGMHGGRLRSSKRIMGSYFVAGRICMARQTPIPDELREQFALARQRGAEALRTEPHGRAVRFSKARRELVIDLINGCQLRMPVDLVPGLENATDADLADVGLTPAGMLVTWDRIDIDHSVMALAILALGEKTVMRASASVAGATRSPAKAAAARANGRKGGRPRKDAAV